MTPEPAQVSILMVDDQESNLVALEACLEPLGAHLVQARSGEEALRDLLERDFAAILLDVQMPGMDGFETADLIRRRDRTRHVPILFLTAINKSDTHVLRGYALGAVDYMFKPIVPEILRSKVQVFVELFRMRERERFMVDALAQKTRELERTNAELRQFAGVLASGLKDPVGQVVATLDGMQGGGEDVASARSAAGRALEAVDDLLAQVRAGTQPLTPEAVDVRALLDEALEGPSGQRLASARVVVERASMPVLVGDRAQLGQLVRSLLEALAEAAEGPARIGVESRRTDDGWRLTLRLSPARAGNEVERALGPAASRAPTTPAALKIGTARMIVERHGGRLGTEPDVGGLTLWLTLPATQEPAAPRLSDLR